MRFIVMHKVDDVIEAGGPPNERIIREMSALVQGSLKSGVFLNGAGLHRSARRVRVKRSGAQVEIARGPYAGENELVAAVTMISTKSMDRAVEQSQKLAQAVGAPEIEIGPVVEPWDLGLMPKPDRELPERFLLLTKSTSADEAGTTREKHAAATKALSSTLGDEGAVLASEILLPSSRAVRLPSGPQGKRTWVDGPFAESKELISGFSVLSVPSRADAIQWAERYAAILDGNEVDVRELYDV